MFQVMPRLQVQMYRNITQTQSENTESLYLDQYTHLPIAFYMHWQTVEHQRQGRINKPASRAAAAVANSIHRKHGAFKPWFLHTNNLSEKV